MYSREHRHLMELIFLGTGAGAPTPQRNVAAVVLRLPQRPDLWLFDCGEATQHRFMASPVSMARVRRIFLSHLHGDHVFGLPGFIATRGMGGVMTSLDVYGPVGTRALVETVLAATSTWVPYPLTIHEIQPGVILDDGAFSVRCAAQSHGIPCFAYRVDEQDQAGHLDAARAHERGVPAGPMLGELKRGQSVRHDGVARRRSRSHHSRT